jgi:molecular chaperone DnaJ
MNKPDLYEVLGVRPNATASEIRRAYRKLARRYHPDINPGDRTAELRYQRISEAFEVLSNPAERERYDRPGTRGVGEPGSGEAGYGFEGFDFTSFSVTSEKTEDSAVFSVEAEFDIFSEVFGKPRSAPNEGAVAGEDLVHHLTMSFEESLSGVETSLQVRRLIACPTCSGWGQVSTGEPDRCPACKGKGRSTQLHGHMVFARSCPECGGAGFVDRRPCPDCEGAGRPAVEETLRVRIPAGVESGSRVRVPGKGNEGRGGGPSGDLMVLIHVTDHPFLKRDGDALFCTVPVTFSEAALGCRIDVPTADGWVKVRVPPGTQSGQKLRLSGRGAVLPYASGEGGKPVRGDLFVTIQLVTPRQLGEKAQAVLRELAQLHPENPREELWGAERESVPRL